MNIFEPASFAGGGGAAEEMVKFALADSTRKVYELGWRKYREFCARHGLQPLAGSRRTVEWFIWEMANRPSSSTGRALSPVSIGAYCCGISNAYMEAGLAPPIDRRWLRRFLQGLNRRRDFAPKQAFPLSDRHILAMLRLCSGGTEEYVFQSLDAAGAPSGLPMTRYELSRLVRDYAGRIGLDPAAVTTRSFRVGFVTVAVVNGASIFKIMEVTRHRNPSTVMEYVRQVGAFRNHAGGGFL